MENSTNDYDLIVVGNGIAAHCLLWNIAENPILKNLKILQLHDDSAFPACSLRTTSVVSMDVHSRGLSELGDLLVNGHESFENFVSSFKPDGVTAGKQFYVYPHWKTPHKISQYHKRYGEEMITEYGCRGIYKRCFLVEPEKMLEFMRNSYLSKLSNHKIIQRKVESINQEEKSLDVGLDKFNYKKLLLATAAYTQFIFKNDELESGVPVSGTYCVWKDSNLFSENKVLTSGHFNIIYRKETNELLFGGTIKEGYILENNLADLHKEYETLKNHFSDIDFPKIETADIFTGIRHKGRRRLPVSKQVTEDIFVLNSLYKNGFSFPFYGSRLVTEQLEKSLSR